MLCGHSHGAGLSARVLDHSQQAPIRAIELELVFFEEPQCMATLDIKSAAAVEAVSNKQPLARRAAIAEAQLGKRLAHDLA